MLVTMQIHKFRRDYAVKQQEQVMFSATITQVMQQSMSCCKQPEHSSQCVPHACLLTARFWMYSLPYIDYML